MPIPGPKCPYCSSDSALVDASAVYGPKFTGQFNVWACAQYPECDSFVGVHRDSPNAAPLGSLANAELRKLRKQVHVEFDQLWKSGRMKRNAAYRKFAELMGMESGKCHVAWFTEQQCEKALAVLAEHSPGRTVAASDEELSAFNGQFKELR